MGAIPFDAQVGRVGTVSAVLEGSRLADTGGAARVFQHEGHVVAAAVLTGTYKREEGDDEWDEDDESFD